MRGRIGIGSIVALMIVSLSASAMADEDAEVSEEPSGIESLVSAQEIGARTGIAAGGRVTPGGLYLGGKYLYQLSDTDWFDGGFSFVFGSGAASCFRDRDDQVVCDHGIAHGFGGELSAGVRRWLQPQGRFVPFVRAGVALGLASFGKDDVWGLTAPLWIGAGVRARVAEGVAVSGGAALAGGVGLYDRDLGLEPVLSLLVTAGVDFGLD